MEPAVHLGVGRLVALVHAPLCEQRVAVVQTGTELAQEWLRGAVLGDAPCRKPLEDAPDVDRVEYVTGRERPYDVAPALVHGEQSLLREQRQCLPHRGAGHAELLRQGSFRHALAGGQLAAQDHLAEMYDRLVELRDSMGSPARVARAHAAW